jgi:hypothetical protein
MGAQSPPMGRRTADTAKQPRSPEEAPWALLASLAPWRRRRRGTDLRARAPGGGRRGRTPSCRPPRAARNGLTWRGAVGTVGIPSEGREADRCARLARLGGTHSAGGVPVGPGRSGRVARGGAGGRGPGAGGGRGDLRVPRRPRRAVARPARERASAALRAIIEQKVSGAVVVESVNGDAASGWPTASSSCSGRPTPRRRETPRSSTTPSTARRSSSPSWSRSAGAPSCSTWRSR